MVHECKHIDIGDHPDLVAIAKEVGATKEPCVLQEDGEDFAVIMPVKRTRQRKRMRSRRFTMEDSLWNIAGMAHSDGPGDVSDNVDKYLAEAYLDRHE